MSESHERRHFWRAVFHSPVRLVTPGGTVYAQLLDISLRGALVEVAPDWVCAVGDDCQMQIELGADAVIAMTTRVNHIAGRHVGLQCIGIDLDSITHLRRLVELNAGDPALLDRELHALVSE